MKYEVIWKPTAENELAQIWLTTADRPAVVRSTAKLEKTLAQSGPDAGESRIGYWRITHEAPLGVYFFAEQGNPKVIVIRLWEYH